MLEHFLKCVNEKKEARIVYLGGSITEGQGVEDKRLCWQGLLQSEMERAYPSCMFLARNAGIGGTDSRFGAFRMERDVLAFRPDLLFVEFAVNDYTRPAEEIRESLEAILYKLWRTFPACDVIFVLTATGKMVQENRERVPESVQIHMEVTEKYQIPFVNVGVRLFSRVRREGLQLELLLPDGVHPNRAGYQIYFEGVWEFLERALKGTSKGMSKEALWEKNGLQGCGAEGILTETGKNGSNRYLACKMVPAAGARLYGFVTEQIAMCGRYGSYVSSCRPGDMLEYSFTGDKIGLFYMISSDGGNMEWSLDGGEFEVLPAWDTYALKFDRGSARMLAENLKLQEHVLCIRVSAGKEAQSKGNFIRISDFLV